MKFFFYQKPLFVFLFLFISVQLFSQKNKGSVEGSIIDASNSNSIEYATVSIFSKKDSLLITGGVTDESGKFKIELPYGIFYAHIDFISFEKKEIENVIINKQTKNLNIGIITLSATSDKLGEIEVLSEKGITQITLAKKIYNVDADLMSKGSSALEILDNVPSVTVDANGKVNLRGNSNVQILVNGKPSALIAGGAEGLQRLQSSSMEKVEVITNPSAKYQADGAAGIINIVLKKNKKEGVNGSVNATIGFPPNLGFGADLNYRTNAFNFFVNYNISSRDRPGFSYYYHRFDNGGILELTDTDAILERNNFSNNIMAGVDYYFNDKNILTTSIYYDKTKKNNHSELDYQDFISNKENVLSTTHRIEDQKSIVDYVEYALTYKKLFEQKGRSLEFDLRLEQDWEDRKSDFIDEIVHNTNGNYIKNQRASNYETSSKWTGSIDYVFPLQNGGNFETGIQTSWREIRNDYLVEEEVNNDWNVFNGLENNFIYKENIHAVYTTFSNSIKKIEYQVGLRVEHSDISTELLTNQKFNPRKNTQLFPSGLLSYELPKQHTVKLSYSRRIRRPGFWDLNPFFTLLDARNFLSGNPNLNPAYTNSYELSHIKYWDKISLSSAIYHRQTSNGFTGIRVVDGEGFTSSMPENLKSQNDYGLEISTSWNPVNIIRLTGEVNFFHINIDGSNIDPTYITSGGTWTARSSARIKLLQSWNLQTRYNYRAARPGVQGRKLGYGYVDVGLSRSLVNKKAKLTFRISDLFNTRQVNQILELDGFTRESGYQYYQRNFNLNLTYKL